MGSGSSVQFTTHHWQHAWGARQHFHHLPLSISVGGRSALQLSHPFTMPQPFITHTHLISQVCQAGLHTFWHISAQQFSITARYCSSQHHHATAALTTTHCCHKQGQQCPPLLFNAQHEAAALIIRHFMALTEHI